MRGSEEVRNFPTLATLVATEASWPLQVPGIVPEGVALKMQLNMRPCWHHAQFTRSDMQASLKDASRLCSACPLHQSHCRLHGRPDGGLHN
ncbi:hypothetical protein HaLaN_22060 [Haematococcus lacustris]|uniref:Uncharacterized protein n=1 Tax=Haematococcus lacustris TaxID=44745 RepID=A0A699ZNN7_HAELA|nr:hypothetical protein HaLaN_22060 [Haematococcus lacustris]